MLNKAFAFSFLLIFMFSFVFATQETLGVFEQGKDVRIAQVCSDATYINISSISYPNSSTAVSNILMTSSGSGEFFYDFVDTDMLGKYDVRGISDGCEKTFATYFEITTNGKESADGIVIVVFSLIFIGLISFGIIYFLKALTHVLDLNMDILDTAIMMATYFAMWMFYYFSKEYLGNAFMNDLLSIAVTIGAYTHVILPIVGFLVSFIMTNLKFKQKQRTTY